jgi:hypothetical protein
MDPELMGCIVVAGRLPILVPAVVGSIFLLVAFVLPAESR